MDANGVRYHLLLGESNWSSCLDELGKPLSTSWQDGAVNNTHLEWDVENNQVILQPLLYYYAASPADRPPVVEDRRGAARDNLGNWYWIDPSQQLIRTGSAGSRVVVDFYPIPEPFACLPSSESPFQPVESAFPGKRFVFSGLAITEGQYLVVGVLDPAGLLVFDLLGGSAPLQVLWPRDIPFVPFDMAPAPGGGLWILDRQNKRYWALDRFFNILTLDQQVVPGQPAQPDIFQPTSGSAHSHAVLNFPQGIRLDDSANLNPLEDPIAIEGLPDGTVLVLDRKPSKKFSWIARYCYGKQLGRAFTLKLMRRVMQESTFGHFRLTAHDFAFVPGHSTPEGGVPDRLYIASFTGNQAFAFHITWTDAALILKPLPEIYLPMRLFSGKGLVCAGEDVFYDLGERWLQLVRQIRPRYHSDAVFYHTFDSRLPGCVWHRLMLDACLPPDTQITISSRAADEQADLEIQPWQIETLYLRNDGSELPFASNVFRKPVQPGSPPPSVPLGSGTWEMLFQHARGQFIQLKFELSGNGQRTPRLRAMRLYYPRFSYLEHYLPSPYRYDPSSSSFLERFLANMEGFYTAAEDKIIHVRQLFDVAGAPPEALDWLAGWFGALLDPSWDDYRRRLFIRYAMVFFQFRGTLRGLRMALRLALDECITPDIFTEPCCSDLPFAGQKPSALRIIESFRSRRFPGVLLGDPTDVRQQGVVQVGALWKPDQGGALLNNLYEQATGMSAGYPIRQPQGDPTAWQTFSLSALGFIPTTTSSDWNLWQAYLMRAYGTPANFNDAYGLSGKAGLESFDEAVLPSDLPPDGPPLEDWYNFETAFLPMAHNAHHFVVLLPMKAGLSKDSQVYQDRLILAKKVIELEKPAHTTYDIRLFWALFRIGEARLGLDTQLDVGSRNPNFPGPFNLGRESLGEAYLASDTPPLPADRLSLQAGCFPGAGAPPPQAKQPQIRYARTINRCAG